MHRESMDATLVKEGARQGTKIQLSELPADAMAILAPLAFDGFLNANDVAHAAQLFKTEQARIWKPRTMMFAFTAVILAILLGNFAVTIVAVNVVDEHFVKTSVTEPTTAQVGDAAVLYQNKQGTANLATSSVVNIVNLTDTRTTASKQGPQGFASYNQIQSLTITRKNGEKLGFKVSGYRWHNASDMDFFLSVGYTVRIQNGQKALLDGVQLTYVDLSRRRLNWLMDDIGDIGGDVVNAAEVAGEACAAVDCEVALLA